MPDESFEPGRQLLRSPTSMFGRGEVMRAAFKLQPDISLDVSDFLSLILSSVSLPQGTSAGTASRGKPGSYEAGKGCWS
jgi:hypothetical protein